MSARATVPAAKPRASAPPRAAPIREDEEQADLEPGKKDPFKALSGRPTTGRTTALGRKVEKPGSSTPGGPSGQKELSQHNRKHANK